MTALDLERVRAAYPPLPDDAPPDATVARLQSLYDAGVAGSDVRRRRRPSRRIALLAIGALIVSGTAVAATGAWHSIGLSGGWHPVLGSPGRGPRPLAANAGVPADQLAALAILRRPETSADRGPLVRHALRILDRRRSNGIHTDAIRVILHTRREFVVLVPLERFGPTNLKGAPIQRHGLCLMSASRQDARTVTITHAGKARTLGLPAGYNWGETCGNSQTLRTTGIQTGTSPDSSGGLIINGLPKPITDHRITLVPDGVARVKVRLRHDRSVTVPVTNNVYRYTIHETSANLGTIWLDAAGHQIGRQKHP